MIRLAAVEVSVDLLRSQWLPLPDDVKILNATLTSDGRRLRLTITGESLPVPEVRVDQVPIIDPPLLNPVFTIFKRPALGPTVLMDHNRPKFAWWADDLMRRLGPDGSIGEEAPQSSRPGVCRVCGCTDEDCIGCVVSSGHPCYWAEPDLCSACVGKTPEASPAIEEG
jgi:hypothetical protein